jgi:hypothetical protein
MEPLYNPIVKRIFTEEESKEILEFLKEKAYVYHTPYKRYNKMVKVPRGQASFTLNENIHYNYGRIAGGYQSILSLLYKNDLRFCFRWLQV